MHLREMTQLPLTLVLWGKASHGSTESVLAGTGCHTSLLSVNLLNHCESHNICTSLLLILLLQIFNFHQAFKVTALINCKFDQGQICTLKFIMALELSRYTVILQVYRKSNDGKNKIYWIIEAYCWVSYQFDTNQRALSNPLQYQPE